MNSITENFFIKKKIKYFKINGEILEILALKSNKKNVNFEIQKFLNDLLLESLNLTFSEKIVIWYGEVITEEIIIIFHEYFRNNCCNIQNITFLTSTSGLKTFYKNYCSLNRSLQMDIVEIPMIDLINQYLSNLEPKKINKSLTRIFSFYGGTYEISPPMRTFLSLFLAQYKNFSSIEIMCKCCNVNNLEDWLEKETFFLNSSFVKKYSDLHKTYINDDLLLSEELKIKIDDNKIYNERFGKGGYQEIVDSHCIMTLVRETVNFQPFGYISEKTFRCFYNHTIPIPVDGKEIISDLKSYGFWIDDHFFDYSYLQEDLFENKIKKLNSSIEKITKLSYSDLTSYYNNNIENFQHNQNLVVNWPNIVDQKLKEKFDKW